VDALADRLIRLIDDPALRERMGERGRSRVEAEFDEDKIVDALTGIYRELLAEPSRLPESRVTSIAES